MRSAQARQDRAVSPADRYQWTAVNLNAPFAARDGAGLLSCKDRLWLLGGWNPPDTVNFPKRCSNEVWSSADGATWDLVKPNTYKDGAYDPATDWEGRHCAGYVVHHGKMWILGGDCNQGRYQPDVWNSEDGVHWTLVNDHLPWGRRALHHTEAFAGKIWVMGGQTQPRFAASEPRSIFYNDVWCSEDGINWQQVTVHAGWEPRGMIGGSAVFNGRIWLLGGGTYDTPEFPERLVYNDVWSSADGVRWERHVKHCPWQPRQYHEVAVFDGRLWVMEGAVVKPNPDGGVNLNDVWHSADGINWCELPNTPWPPRHAASVAVHRGALWVIAGNNMTPDVWKLHAGEPPASMRRSA